jgi:hypothetical protein
MARLGQICDEETAMPTNVTCSNAECGASFEVPDEQAGGIVLCPECGTAVQVSAAGGDELEDLDAASAPQHHPARQQCPNCGELLGVRDAICRHCGADIRTGAVAEAAVKRKKSKLVPVLVGGGIIVALAVLGGLIFVAVQLLSKEGDGAAADVQPEEPVAAAPAEGGPPAQPGGAGPRRRRSVEPGEAAEPEFRMAEAELGDLSLREQQIEQAVQEYEERLKAVLSETRTASRDELAGYWADLYAFCLDAGLDAEAEHCWARAVALRPTGGQANAMLGRTERYAGVPVTPEQKAFLDALAPTVTVVNRDPALQDHVVRIDDGDETPLPWDAAAQLTASAGTARIAVAPRAGAEGPSEELLLDLRNGLEYRVTLQSPLASPDVGFDELRAIYMAVAEDEGGGDVAVRRDWQEEVLSARKGDVEAVRSEGGPLVMQLGGGGSVLSVTGSIMAGSPYLHGGQAVLCGTDGKPLRLGLDGQSETVSLRAGIHYDLEIDLADGLWGVLGTAQGDLASEWARRKLVAHADAVAFASAEKEAEGGFVAPWQATEAAYEQMEAARESVDRDLAYQDRAAARAPHLDRVRALGIEDRVDYLYLNWPRYRDALAALSQDSYDVIMEQVSLLRAPAGSSSRGRGMPGMATGMGGPGGRGGSRASRAPEEEETGSRPTPRRPRSSLPYDPPSLALRAAARREVLMAVLPVLPDHVAIQQIEDNWAGLSESARRTAFASLEAVGTREAISFLGRLSEEAGQTDMVVLSLLALGEIGTREALIYLDAPAFADEVKMASLAAKAGAGDPETLENLPELLGEFDQPAQNLFLSFATSMDTPATVVVLSQAIDMFSEADARRSIAEALARLGGDAAARQLARLIQLSGDVYSDLLAQISPDSAVLLIRAVGNAVGQGKGGEEAVAFLTGIEDDAAYAFLRAAAQGKGGTEVIYELIRGGSGTALAAALDTAASVNIDLLERVRESWYTYDADGEACEWQDHVDPAAVEEFLRAVLSRNSNAKVQLAAARMLTEIGKAPEVGVLVVLAQEQRKAKEAPRPGRRGGGGPPGGGGPRMGPPMGPPAGLSFGPGRGQAARAYELDGFDFPDGKPAFPDDFDLAGPRQFYSLGLLERAGGEAAADAVRELLIGYEGADLRAAAMEVLAVLGREEDLELLRSLASTRKGSYADKPALAREMQDRLAALGAIGTARDASFLPRVLDIMDEEPPAEAAVSGLEEDEYADLSGWFQLMLRRGACENLMRMCRDQQLSELVADRNVQNEMVRRLIGIIEEPGADQPSLEELNRTVRARAVAAFGRCADYYDEETRLVLKRLALSVRAPGSRPRRGIGPGRVSAPGGPRGASRAAERGPSMEAALKDAVVHMAVRGGGLTLLNEMSSLLPRAEGEDAAWSSLMVQLATAPTPEYFSVLNMVFDSLKPDALWRIFESTRGKADAYDLAYARYVAKMVRGPGREDLTKVVPAGQPPTGPGGPPPGVGGPPPGVQMGPPPEVLERIEALNRFGPGARISAPTAGGGRGSRPRQLSTVDRTVARRQARWSYSLGNLLAEVEETKSQWDVVEVLFKSSAGAVAAAVESEGLLNHPQFGPAIAAMYVERTPGAREDAVRKLRAILTEQDEISGRGAARLDRQRSAAAALRRLGGEDSAEALYDGLVGPEQERRTATGPGIGPPPGVRGPTGPTGPTGPMGPMGPMGPGRGGSRGRPVAVYIARALGTMGEAERLRAALTASDRQFFSSSRVSIQTAALEGMAFMPGDARPLKVLQELLRLANTQVLKQAASDAIVIALRRTAG